MNLKLLVAAVLALTLAGCNDRPGTPINRGETGNPNVGAEHIAMVDGCKVWRLYDKFMGRTVYVTKCPSGAAPTSWRETCGKGCTREVQNLALNKED